MPSALIVGGAECVWDDARRALALFEPDAIFAINDMIVQWQTRIDYAVTLHPDKIARWRTSREKAGGNTNFQTWAHKHFAKDIHKILPDWSGSSGLFAVKIALTEGFAPIVLAGVPMDGTQGHIIRKTKWLAADMFRRGWNRHLAEIKPMTKSMSGWTKELLGGEPTPEWLLKFGSAPPNPRWLALQEKADGQLENST